MAGFAGFGPRFFAGRLPYCGMRLYWRGWFCAVAAVCSSCVSTQTEVITLNRYEFDQPEMGSPFRIVLYAPNPAIAEKASASAFQRIKQLNDMMTDYDSDSELSKLSRTSGQGRPVHVSHDLWVVLQRAQSLAERSGGAFDITVGPYVNLWRQARREGTLPDPTRLQKATQSVGYKNVKLDPAAQTVTLLAPNMRLDLGGIAKGYAVDQAVRVLSLFGVGCALVSGGGDLEVSGPPPGKRGWRIELPPLDASNAPPARIVLLSHAGLSTSGDLFQRVEVNGKRYSHIVDPRTGMGLTDHSLVTVIAPDDFTADGLTKVMSVLGPKEAMQFLKGTPHIAVRIVRKPGDKIEQYESRQFHRYYQP
jgi:thiamine biosynthesis lipoprotein